MTVVGSPIEPYKPRYRLRRGSLIEVMATTAGRASIWLINHRPRIPLTPRQPEVGSQENCSGGFGVPVTFNGHGYLEPGIHSLDRSEIEAAFVTTFPHSNTRKSILDGYHRHCVDLLSIVPSCEQYLDGSFVSTKNDPGDIDMVIMADAAVIDALPDPMKARLKALVSGPVTKAAYLCDVYFCPTYPDTHPMHSKARAQRKYWLGEFGYDRNDVPKGIVHVKIEKPAASAGTP